jgi:hypothetical protein
MKRLYLLLLVLCLPLLCAPETYIPETGTAAFDSDGDGIIDQGKTFGLLRWTSNDTAAAVNDCLFTYRTGISACGNTSMAFWGYPFFGSIRVGTCYLHQDTFTNLITTEFYELAVVSWNVAGNSGTSSTVKATINSPAGAGECTVQPCVDADNEVAVWNVNETFTETAGALAIQITDASDAVAQMVFRATVTCQISFPE